MELNDERVAVVIAAHIRCAFPWVSTMRVNSNGVFHLYDPNDRVFALASVTVGNGELYIGTMANGTGIRHFWDLELSDPDFFDRLAVVMGDLRALLKL